MEIFDTLESEVRSYSRLFPAVFERAVGSRLFDESGRDYIDFFSGAGTLNYGHNNPVFKERLIDYLRRDGITHSLDMATQAKRELLDRFQRVILAPRGLSYKVQFPGPTGTNAVEAALKLARKVTGRSHVLYFHNAYHGMTRGRWPSPAALRSAGGLGCRCCTPPRSRSRGISATATPSSIWGSCSRIRRAASTCRRR